jgi:hypothetical protein
MIKPLFAFALFLTGSCVQAQIISQQVTSTTGAYSAVGSYSLSYTVGEMAAVETFTGGSTILTQGFQQPNDIINGLLDIERDANGSFIVYPNPASEQLWYGYEFDERGHVDVELYDITGRKLEYTLSEGYDSGKVSHSLNCSAYASGHYILSARFTTGQGQVKTISKKFQILN